MKVSIMLNALQIATQGLLSSGSQVALSASHIVTASMASFKPDIIEASVVNRSNNAYQQTTRNRYDPASPSRLSGRPGSTLTPHAGFDTHRQNSSHSLIDETIRFQIAAHAYKANALVIRTLDKTTGSFLEKIL